MNAFEKYIIHKYGVSTRVILCCQRLKQWLYSGKPDIHLKTFVLIISMLSLLHLSHPSRNLWHLNIFEIFSKCLKTFGKKNSASDKSFVFWLHLNYILHNKFLLINCKYNSNTILLPAFVCVCDSVYVFQCWNWDIVKFYIILLHLK